MSYQVKQGDIFGRVGEGLGKGLSEQLPKEVERYRLSQGLQDFEKKHATSTPFQQAAYLYGIPGMTEEKASNLIRLNEEANARRQAIEEGERNRTPTGEQKTNNFNQQPQQNINQTNILPPSVEPKSNLKSIVTPESEKAIQTPILKPTPEQIRPLAATLMRESPNLYRTPQQGYEEAERRLNAENAQIQGQQAAATAQQGLANQVKGIFNEKLGQKLQKGGTETFSDVIGDIQNDYQNLAEDAVANGKMTAKEAADHYSKEALVLAKALTNLKTLGEKSIFTGSRTANKEAIDSVRKKFEKIGRGREFADYLVSTQNLSMPYARNIAFPIKNNKELNNDLAKIKTQRYHTSDNGQKEIKIANDLSSKIKDTDSLLAIGLQLQNKNYDPQSFMSEIKKLNETKKISLSDMQLDEFEKGVNFAPTMGDYYLYAFTGIEPLEIL